MSSGLAGNSIRMTSATRGHRALPPQLQQLGKRPGQLAMKSEVHPLETVPEGSLLTAVSAARHGDR